MRGLTFFFVIGGLFFALPLFVNADIIINEIAWMGTSGSHTDEWVELHNSGGDAVDLEGWKIFADDGSPDVSLAGTISAGGFFLLERSNDDSVPGVTADLIYTGALGNGGEVLRLHDTGGAEVDVVSAADGWPAGDNETKDTMQWGGGSWVTAAPTPREANAGGSASSPVNPVSSSPSKTDAGTNVVDSTPPPQKKITAKIENAPDTVVVGARAFFDGAAYGLIGAPLKNARYRWSFGDGSTTDGRHVAHTFEYPGRYVVVLNVSSGEYSASRRATVEALPLEIAVSRVGTPSDFFIELKNHSSQEVNLSDWLLKHGASYFRIPLNTFLLPKGTVIFSSAVTGFDGEGTAELLYPNGKRAAQYERKETVDRENKSTLQTSKNAGASGVFWEGNNEEKKRAPVDRPRENKGGGQEDEASEMSAALPLSEEERGGAPVYVWIIALFSLVAAGVAGFLFSRKSRNPADGFAIIEDIPSHEKKHREHKNKED